MLGILFGILILVLLAVGLTRRKRSDRTWVKAERYEESGDWLDKRPGERGSWGSLDAEMTQDRRQLVRQGRIVELAELLRAHVSAGRTEEEVRTFRTYTRTQAAQMIAGIEQVEAGQMPSAAVASAGAAQQEALKKQILDFAYRHYPGLLDLDIDTLRAFDLAVGNWAAGVMTEGGKTA